MTEGEVRAGEGRGGEGRGSNRTAKVDSESLPINIATTTHWSQCEYSWQRGPINELQRRSAQHGAKRMLPRYARNRLSTARGADFLVNYNERRAVDNRGLNSYYY